MRSSLRHRPAEHGRSTEAEVHSILEEAVRPAKRLKIGTELFRIGQEVGGMDDLEIPDVFGIIQSDVTTIYRSSGTDQGTAWCGSV